MAERKKYSEDPRIKEWTQKSLKKNFEELRIQLKKAEKAKFRAYAEYLGKSMSSIVTDAIREKMERDGFVYTPENEESADE